MVTDKGATASQPLLPSDRKGCSVDTGIKELEKGYLNARIMVEGSPGLCGGPPYSADCFLFDPKNKQWTKMATMKEERRRAFAIQINQNEFIIMGETEVY